MPIGLHIYRINPEVDYKVKELIFNKGERIYGEFKKADGTSEPLKVYIHHTTKIDDVTKVEAYFDVGFRREIRFYKDGKLEKKPLEYIESQYIRFIVYPEISGSSSINNVVVFLSPKKVVEVFVDKIEKIIGTPAFLPLRLRIDASNEADIRNKFDDVRRVNVRDLSHSRLTSMGFGGYTRIHETNEWTRAFHTFHGKASFIGLLLDDYWFYISEMFTMIVFHRIDEDTLIEKLRELIRRLLEANAIYF